MSAAEGALRSLPAAPGHVPVGTGALLGPPPPGVAVIPLLQIPAALWALAAGRSPGTGRKSGAGALPARTTPAGGLALGTRLVALGGLAVAPLRPAPLGGPPGALPSDLSSLLPVFASFP